MKQVIVRYRVKPERAAENEELVRAVYAELQETKPAGLRYATFQLDDGVSFVHIRRPRRRTARTRSRACRHSSASRRTSTTAAKKGRS